MEHNAVLLRIAKKTRIQTIVVIVNLLETRFPDLNLEIIGIVLYVFPKHTCGKQNLDWCHAFAKFSHYLSESIFQLAADHLENRSVLWFQVSDHSDIER